MRITAKLYNKVSFSCKLGREARIRRHTGSICVLAKRQSIHFNFLLQCIRSSCDYLGQFRSFLSSWESLEVSQLTVSKTRKGGDRQICVSSQLNNIYDHLRPVCRLESDSSKVSGRENKTLHKQSTSRITNAEDRNLPGRELHWNPFYRRSNLQ